MLLYTFVCKFPGGHIFSFLLGIYLTRIARLCGSIVWSLLSRVWLFATLVHLFYGSSVHGILQTRILEWVAIPFSRPGDLPNPGTDPGFPALQADFLPSEPPGKPKALERLYGSYIFNHLRNWQAVSQSGGPILHSHQQCVWFPVFLFFANACCYLTF